MRWFGPEDPVSLRDLRQCGCEGVMTALHQYAYGELWPLEAIRERKTQLAAENLKWLAVESVPVSEAIKTRTGDFEQHIENYQQTIRNLGAEGIDTVIYNFMPVLDWVRTDMAYPMADGTQTVSYDPVLLAVFDCHILQRSGAEHDYSEAQLEAARVLFQAMRPAERNEFTRTLIDVFPGMGFGFGVDDIRAMLRAYTGIGREQLFEHLRLFLNEVIPVCESAGVRLAIHPDDPPWALLGLPRIVATEDDLQRITQCVDNTANGICFCSGSLSCRDDNDLPGIVDRLGHRINAVHLRSTQRNADGSFFEAAHLGGVVDMPAVVERLLAEIQLRQQSGREDQSLCFRPDHGRVMLDDLTKPALKTPGYSCIGRMRGLAEIRGLQLGIARHLNVFE
ncbi:mannonate dehydratase [Coraliomargarita akajimensis]|uniref:Mannonate dehydratase n=1 Tax=Coraliomargarita akajimensis (strain DSM 45221 / IAM 15411 / JCM 23193 / KCTC 12865 / 04OKA010-24) TaxID=583355 RepID=D5EN47_CORAD|nr:mannonate dehydratase [Coraliomargarita akajimensis]ADE53482.1 mannonate dehydratase [Coraliomargarita akajimensis DSM 45221]